MTKPTNFVDVPNPFSSQKKGNSKASPTKGKGLVKSKSSKGKAPFPKKVVEASNTFVDIELNPVLTQSNFVSSLRSAFESGKDFEVNEERRGLRASLIHHPFSAGRLFNLLRARKEAAESFDLNFLEKLKNELFDLDFIPKNNDLYQFHQTKDLASKPDSPQHPYLNAFKKILKRDVKKLMEEVTGIELSDEVDLFCGKYCRTDYLLCHDDELEGRRIAFILYLVPDWSEEDGGALDLFSTDERGQPDQVVRSFFPVSNAFAFFPVGPKSFHQVAEVLSEDKVRLSLSGWFHGSPADRPVRVPETPTPSTPWIPSSQDREDNSVSDWISPMFFDAGLAKEIRRKFGRKSEIQLEDFIRADKIEALTEELNDSSSLKWTLTGPANKSRYYMTPLPSFTTTSSTTPHLTTLLNVLRSEEMFFLLSHLTGLKLHPESQDFEDEEESESEEEEEEESGEEEEERLSKMADWVNGSTIDDDYDAEDVEPVVKKSRRSSDETELAGTKDPLTLQNEVVTVSDHDPTMDSTAVMDDTTTRSRNMYENKPALETTADGASTVTTFADATLTEIADTAATKITETVSTKTTTANATLSVIADVASTPCCALQVRKWSRGCYSLLGDLSVNKSPTTVRSLLMSSELDVCLCIGVDPSWNPARHGGATVYVAKDEEEELLNIAPKHNALSLVFRERDTAKFVKHVNCEAPGHFFEVAAEFTEVLDVETIEG